MPRRLLIRGAQPLIPCTPLSRPRRYKNPCRAIFCLSCTTTPVEITSTTRCFLLLRPATTCSSPLSANYCRDKPREPTCYYRFLRRFDTSQHFIRLTITTALLRALILTILKSAAISRAFISSEMCLSYDTQAS